MTQYIVAFDASTSRPVISSSPAASSSMSGSPAPGNPPRVSASSGDRSVAANPVSVLAGAHMAGRVKRQAAQRAWRAAGRDQLKRSLGERARRSGCDRYPQDRRAVLGEFLSQWLDRLVAQLLSLDDHALALPVPGQGDGSDPEIFHQRLVEW